MHLSPDEVVLWQAGWVKLNLTIVTTWALMAVLAGGAHLVTRRLSTTLTLSRWQNVLEIVVLGLREQIVDAGLAAADRYLPFIRHTVPVRRAGQPVRGDPGLCRADRLAVDEYRPGPDRVRRRARLRHRRAWPARLPQRPTCTRRP